MKLRKLLNGPVGITVVVVAVALALVFIATSGTPGPKRNLTWGTYYYDLGSKQLFVADFEAYPPIDAPSGPNNGVRAMLYACGNCDDRDQRFIGFLEKYTDESVVVLRTPGKSATEIDAAATAGYRVRSENDENWVHGFSPEGAQVLNAPLARCSGKPLTLCKPTQEEAGQ